MLAYLVQPSGQPCIHLPTGKGIPVGIGTSATSVYRLNDMNGKEGHFFVFPDLLIPLEGLFKLKVSTIIFIHCISIILKFCLFERIDSILHQHSSIQSSIFQVFSPILYPKILDSTQLSRSFARQGVKIRLRTPFPQKRASVSSIKEIQSSSDSLEENKKLLSIRLTSDPHSIVSNHPSESNDSILQLATSTKPHFIEETALEQHNDIKSAQPQHNLQQDYRLSPKISNLIHDNDSHD